MEGSQRNVRSQFWGGGFGEMTIEGGEMTIEGGERLGFQRGKIRNWNSRACPSLFGGENIEGEREEERGLSTSKRRNKEKEGKKRKTGKRLSFPLFSFLPQGYNKKRGAKF